jgi:adenine-specific DNA methylase
MSLPVPSPEPTEPQDRRGPSPAPFGLEKRFDASFVAALALREKQIQQNYRPIIGIHKWFARRPGSVFRSLMLSEFVDAPLHESYWQSNDVAGLIADPFMGGGTTIFEALRVGLAVVGCDINPMAYWLVRQAVEPLDLGAFRSSANEVIARTAKKIAHFYSTSCLTCRDDVPVKYFMWTKVCPCPECSARVDLHPGYLVAEASRHPNEVYHCPSCQTLCEIDAGATAQCPTCARPLDRGNASRGRADCLSCGANFTVAQQLATPPEHHLFAMEYHCPGCYSHHPGRQFKAPDADDRRRYQDAAASLAITEGDLHIPTDAIPAGDETTRLHRWGYHRYRDMFNDRQLLGLGLLINEIGRVTDQRIRHALATVFSDFLRYQNLLARYDTYALKCQDIFSVHGFPVGLIACENNLLGVPGVGSGSFVHFVEKHASAKTYAQKPYETRVAGSRKTRVHMLSERIEAPLSDHEPIGDERSAWLTCEPSQDLALVPETLDAVFTDPPYFANVQYAELMDFCFVWLRQVLGSDVPQFERSTTRTEHEMTGNNTLGRDLLDFTAGLSSVFSSMSSALKKGRPLSFTYHHNDPLAYAPLVVALLDAGLTCTAVLPAPAEMSASLHIAGTKSSILDSIFVCRHRDWARRRHGMDVFWKRSVDERIADDTAKMDAAGYTCTAGDLQCLRAGHIAAEAVRSLGSARWTTALPLKKRFDLVCDCVAGITRGAA